jgi:uncharacterized membrane protein
MLWPESAASGQEPFPGRILVEASLQYDPLEKDRTIAASNATLDFKLTEA